MAASVKTRNAQRRSLQFTTMRDLLAEIDRVADADASGALGTTGNWTAGQVMQHVGRLIQFSFDGFDFKAPWVLRTFGPRVKHTVLRKPFPAGLQLRGASRALIPDASVTTQEGAEYLRAQISRIAGGERMDKPSPVFGPLTHEEWTAVHLKHAALHFGFLHPPVEDASQALQPQGAA
jgi:hypothetical protein